MSFRLVPKSVTLSDLERRNGRYFALFQRIRVPSALPGVVRKSSRSLSHLLISSCYKTRDILLSDSVNCTVLRAVVLTQYRRVTDGPTNRQTDGQTDRRNCYS